MQDKSKLTARARNSPSVPMRRLNKALRLSGSNMLDYGSGKGFDAKHYGMAAYDPYHNPDENLMKVGIYDVITCNYVLNVIPTPAARQAVLDNIRILLKKGGIAYVTIRRDVKTEGYTKRGTYQENVRLDLPVLWENSNYCTYLLRY